MTKRMKALLLGLSVFMLVSCNMFRFSPSNGTTFQQFENEWVGVAFGDPLLRRVGRNGPWEVYETRDDFYYFEDGILRKADEGEIWANCLNKANHCELSNDESTEVEH